MDVATEMLQVDTTDMTGPWIVEYHEFSIPSDMYIRGDSGAQERTNSKLIILIDSYLPTKGLTINKSNQPRCSEPPPSQPF